MPKTSVPGTAERAAAGWTAATRSGLEVVVVVALVDHVPPSVVDRGRVHPCLQRHSRGELQRGRVRDVHPSVRPVERRAQRRTCQRLSTLRSRSSRCCRCRMSPQLSSPAPSSNEYAATTPQRARSRRCDVRKRPEIAFGVDGSYLVAVRRVRGHRGVAVSRSRSGELGEVREVRAADALAAIDPIAGHCDVVGRGPPGKVDPCRAGGGGGESPARTEVSCPGLAS